MLGDGRDVKLVYGGALLLRLFAPVRGNIVQKRGARMIGGEFNWRMREEKIFSKPALVFGNRSEALKFFGVDDGQVKARFGAVVKKNRIDDFARPSRQSERNVGNAQNGARVWQRTLDEANALHRFDGAADVIFVASGAGENKRIKDDVFRRQAIFLGKQRVAALSNGQLALPRERLRLQFVLINAPADHRSTEIVGNRNDFLEFFLAVFEVNRIDDRFPLAISERLRDRARIGRIDHHRRFYLTNQLFVERRNIFLLVTLGALQTDVDNVRTAANLPTSNFTGLFPLLVGHQIFEQPRTDNVSSLAHQQRPRAVLGFDSLNARIDRPVLLRGTLPRLLTVHHLRDCANVLLGRAAASTD